MSYRVPVLEQFEYQQAIISILATPPITPAKGDRYIVGPSATGAYLGKENQIAWYDGAVWKFDIPSAGWVAYVATLNFLQIFKDSAWGEVGVSKAYVDGAVVGLLDDRGSYNASVNTFPAAGGSGTNGAVMKGDIWFVSVGGTLGGVAVTLGDTVRALTDAPGQTATNWNILESNFGYVPENIANKDIDGALTANSDVKYASQKAVKTYADTKATLAEVKADADIANALANAHTKNTDTMLDDGGANQVTAAQAKEAYNKRGVYDAALGCIVMEL